MIVSGTIGSFNWVQEEVPTLPFVLTNNAILGLNASILARLAHLDKSCGYASFRRKYLRYPPRGIQPTKFFTFNDDNPCDVGWLTAKAAAAGNPCFNFYNILDRCPIKTNNLDAHNLGFTAPNQQVYFDRADVKAALHAPNIKWEQCTQTPIFLEDVDCFATAEQCTHDLSPDPIESVLPKVIEYTNRVLIANGALDTAIMSLGTLLSIQNMTWNGKLGFQKEPNTPVILTLPDLMYRDFTFHGLEDPSGTMGTQHFERGLMYTEVSKA
jgi:carboxypeptidase D